MEALKILGSISTKMTKSEIVERVDAAKTELNLLDIHQVAEALGGKVANIRNRAINNGIGTKVGRMGRVYTPADIEKLRGIIDATHRPETLTMIKEMSAMRETGASNKKIALAFGVDASYVTKLLR